jgi:hypothetical protein
MFAPVDSGSAARYREAWYISKSGQNLGEWSAESQEKTVCCVPAPGGKQSFPPPPEGLVQVVHPAYLAALNFGH